MTIIGIIGTLGCGKTILMVFFAWVYKNVKGKVVYANFTLYGVESIDKITDIRMLSDCVVLIDDIIPWLDSRQSQVNMFVTYLLMASRKKGLVLIYTSQIDTGSDVRLRVITNIVCYPSLYEFPVFVVEIWAGFKEEKTSELICDDLVLEYGEDIYEWYDTDEIAYQHISSDEIVNLYNDLGVKVLFTHIFSMRYSMPKNIADAVYDFVKADRMDYVAELIGRSGYVMDDVHA